MREIEPQGEPHSEAGEREILRFPGPVDREVIEEELERGALRGVVEELIDNGKHVFVKGKSHGRIVLIIGTSVAAVGASLGLYRIRRMRKKSRPGKLFDLKEAFPDRPRNPFKK